jgi:predicted DNA-binding ribbon-helix-helix protein
MIADRFLPPVCEPGPHGTISVAHHLLGIVATRGGWLSVRKLISLDEEVYDKLKQLARDRMATLQELADEAFDDLLKKHGVPVDLKDALRKSAALSKMPAKAKARATRKSRS